MSDIDSKPICYGISAMDNRLSCTREDDRKGLAIHITGPTPENEDGTFAVSERLLEKINQQEIKLINLTDIAHKKNIDAEAIDKDGNIIQIQVVRALIDQNFWRDLDINRTVNKYLSKEDAVIEIKKAIALKTNKIEADVRTEIILALDATDLPALASQNMANYFIQQEQLWLEQQGFKQIWLVGPVLHLVNQIF